MSERPVRLGLIGCGDVAFERHLPTIAASADVRLIATCDRDQERAARAALESGTAVATTAAAEVFGNPAIDAVIIATSPWVTPDLTIAALRAGKDVLCEKPMALSLAKAAEVREAEAASGRIVQVGFVLRHGPLFSTLRRWIAEDRLGAPLSFRISIFDEIWDPVGAPEHYARIMATLEHGAPCVHDGAHTMDHLHYLTGSHATRLVSWGQKTRPEFPRANYNLAVIGFANGDTARVEIGWFMPDFPAGEWNIVGPKGIATFCLHERSVTLRSECGEETVALDEDWIPSCFRYQLAAFVEAVRSRVPPQAGVSAGLTSLALCQAFERGMDVPFHAIDVTYERDA